MRDSLVFSFFLLVSASAFTAADLPPMFPTGAYIAGLYARDASTGHEIANQLITYYFQEKNNSSIPVTVIEQTDANGSLTAYLNAGVWSFLAEADDYGTPGKDFTAVGEINVSRDASFLVYFQEVASVRGEVADEFGNLISNAQLKIECVRVLDKQWLNKEKLVSDANGNFMLRFIPTGACRITASLDSKTGFADVNLKRGELKQTRITLKNMVDRGSEEFNKFNIILILLAILLAATVFFFYFKRAKPTAEKAIKPRESAAKKSVKSGKLTEKKRMVLNALNERERSVAELLLANEGRMKQAKIARELLMPKTSLLRAVQSLEKRNIVKTTPFGKHKIVEFTDWFKNL